MNYKLNKNYAQKYVENNLTRNMSRNIQIYHELSGPGIKTWETFMQKTEWHQILNIEFF